MKDHEIGTVAIHVIDTLARFTLYERMESDGKMTEEDYRKYLDDLPTAESKIIDLFQDKRYKILKALLAKQEVQE